MLISDKLKSFDFTYAEKEIVKYFLNQKEEIARRSGQKDMQQVMEEDIERKKR